MAFTDNFNRANENVEADASWTRVDGAAGAAKIVSNQVEHSSATNSAYQCPDQSDADHYTQAVNRETASNEISFQICNRLTDSNNWVGIRNNADKWELYKRDTGSFSLLGSYSVASSSGDVDRLEVSGNDYDFILNSTSRITATDSFNNTETRQGFVVRTSGGPWFDDFEAGALAGGGTTSKLVVLSRRRGR